MTNRKRYAIVGAGGRAGMYVEAVAHTYRDVAELVGLCDLSQTRMDWYNRKLANTLDMAPVPTYHADQFSQMIAEARPETVIVTTIDATHHHYITEAMKLGCDVITEKPMTTDLPKLQALLLGAYVLHPLIDEQLVVRVWRAFTPNGPPVLHVAIVVVLTLSAVALMRRSPWLRRFL